MQGEKKKIIVVEDEVDLLSVLTIRLCSKGFEVLTAENGSDGLLLIRENRPDLALLDVLLPGMNGLKICGAVKSDPVLKHIPVIMVTAAAGRKDIEDGFKSGADAYIIKPYEWEELYENISGLLYPA